MLLHCDDVTAPFYLDLIDRRTSGARYYLTPLFAEGSALSALTGDLLAAFEGTPFDVIAGIDALGFILGAAMATRAGTGLVAVRKGGKLPLDRVDRCTFTDYTGTKKSLELRPGAVRPGMRVLLVDEWVETGAQVSAALELIEGQGAVVVGIAAVCMNRNSRTAALEGRVRCVSVWQGDD